MARPLAVDKAMVARALVELADVAAERDIEFAWTSLEAGLRAIGYTPDGAVRALLWKEQVEKLEKLQREAGQLP